jgi:hypothetical protein
LILWYPDHTSVISGSLGHSMISMIPYV